MLPRPKILLVMIIAALAVVPTARAGWVQHVNRSLGIWWSDGYHSRTNCPPDAGRHVGPYRYPGGEPGWNSYLQPVESLPTPAPMPPTSRLVPRTPTPVR